MSRRLKDPELGSCVRVDRPLPPWLGWAVIVVVALFISGGTLLMPDILWWLFVPLFAVGLIASMYIFGERFLIEQRIYERALVSRSLIPFVGTYILPLAAIDPASVRVTGRFRASEPGAAHLPAARVLRSVPWGQVVRLHGPSPTGLRELRRSGSTGVPADIRHLSPLLAMSEEWVFSFTGPDATVHQLVSLINAENTRLGPGGLGDRRAWMHDA